MSYAFGLFLTDKEKIYSLIGAFLVLSSASLSNVLIEKKEDAMMLRTKKRKDYLKIFSFWWFVVFLLFIGGCFLTPQRDTLLFFILGFIFYVGIYTPLKKMTPLALYIGTIPGAIPAFAGAYPNPWAYYLFVLLVFWQIPHFLALSLLYKKDYEKAHFRVHSVIYGERKTRKILEFFLIIFFIVTMSVFIKSWLYLTLTFLFNLVLFLIYKKNMRYFFLMTLIYLPLFFIPLFFYIKN